ncbi:prolipoprotein diacylglyceryl transferase [Luteipulveratus halotolerans]|uniref:Phosphatidylglycerol--prolipoprotein diacylglyceryl transferase n=1 Tax=Luteipulveratus halotolerans TaxID=1631356 RepID=A0A0L6CHJ7_9MICO|nr:prolipoprotein diacylglyceryl transferase [Luteipulveratus halotolerans]KNX37277.1 diacylglyceryl transferase [Luteipulveratus halotolerans]
MITSIPSPTSGVWDLGPFPLRAYAMCILAGIAVAIWICGRRLVQRGHQVDDALTVAYWAVPFGIVGGRLYHVITTPQPYFGEHGRPVDALKIWHGGLGIWGAVALGALGAWIGCRRHGIAFLDYADAAAPGVAVAQAMGRWGNYFNNELYGRHTDVPWALEIHQWDNGQAVRNAAGDAVLVPGGPFHPTFLYESLWCLLIALVVVLLDRRRGLGRGRSFSLYVMLYPIGRIVFELMRSDPANHVLGLRVNVWVCIAVFLGGLAMFVWCGRRSPDGTVAARDAVSTSET